MHDVEEEKEILFPSRLAAATIAKMFSMLEY